MTTTLEEPETIDTGFNTTDEHDDTMPVLQPELTPEAKIETYIRKEQVLRDAQTELNTLEDQQSECRRKMNSYRKLISDARAKVQRLISCDVHGFIQWEKDQELPLLRLADEAANAWKNEPISMLDVTEKDKEKLVEYFITCGQVADWLCKDFPDKKPGISGEKTKDRIRNAINKLSGVEANLVNIPVAHALENLQRNDA